MKIDDVDGILADLDQLHGIFKKLKIKFFMQEGLALGMRRNGGVLPWDHDIDLGISQPLTSVQMRHLYKGLMSNGWWITPSEDFIFGTHLVKLNIWIWHHEPPYYVARPSSTPGQKAVFPHRFFHDPQPVELMGKTFYIPNHIEGYLHYRYGEWQTEIRDDDVWKKMEKKGQMKKWKHKMPYGIDPEEWNYEFLQ